MKHSLGNFNKLLYWIILFGIIIMRMTITLAEDLFGLSILTSTTVILVMSIPFYYMLKIIVDNKPANIQEFTREFINKLQDQVSTNKQLCIIAVEIENYKELEEIDGALKIITDELEKITRNNDYLVRLKDNEFALVYESNTSPTFFEHRLEDTLKCISKSINNTINFSTGMSMFPKDGTTFEQLINKASNNKTSIPCL